MFLLSVPIYCKLERTCTKTIILFVQQNQTEVQTLGVSLRSIRLQPRVKVTCTSRPTCSAVHAF